MPGHLYFVCPTDHLETVIESHFSGDHYFVSSLGNSIDFNSKFATYLANLIETKGITEISFVLAEDNVMLKNVQKIKEFKGLRRLHKFYQSNLKSKTYGKDEKHKLYSKLPEVYNCLCLRVEDFNSQVSNRYSEAVRVNAKVYYRQKNNFKEVSSHMDLIRHICLN